MVQRRLTRTTATSGRSDSCADPSRSTPGERNFAAPGFSGDTGLMEPVIISIMIIVGTIVVILGIMALVAMVRAH